MLQIVLVLLGISVCGFAAVMIYEPRTLWSGAAFLWMLLCAALTLFFVLLETADWLAEHPVLMYTLMFLLIAAVFFVLFLPALLTAALAIEGIRVIRHEGLKPANALLLSFAALLLLYLTLFPPLGGGGHGMPALSTALSLPVLYALSLMAVYLLSAALNLFHWQKAQHADYIIVLGAGLAGKRVTPLLAARIDRGIELLRCNPGALLILSGGQGPGEDIAEGEAMADYARQKGVGAEQIIVEDRSTSTEENLLFSETFMKKEHPKVLIVTTAYHVFRALLLARQQGLRCKGFGAKTKWYFTLNALIREFIGYLSLTWKQHSAAAAVITVIAVLSL